MSSTAFVHIRPSGRWRWLNIRELWEYRDLLLSLGLRDVMLRYKQTLLGVVWVVLQPIVSAGILTAVFGFVAAAPSPAGVPYFVFAYLGQMAWTLFGLTLARTGGALVGNGAIVLKIYFPRIILPLATLLAVLLDFLIGFSIALPMVFAYTTHISLWAVVISGLGLILAATGLGLIVAAISAKFRDILFLLPLVVQLGLYASPVAYGLDIARDNLAKYSPRYFDLYMLNPLSALIEAFRWGLLGQGLFLPGYFVYGMVASLALFAAGVLVFQSSAGKFADVI